MKKKVEKVAVKIERNTNGLRQALFDEIDALVAGTSNAQIAVAKSKLAAQIVAAVRLDLEYSRFVKTTKGPNKLTYVPLGK